MSDAPTAGSAATPTPTSPELQAAQTAAEPWWRRSLIAALALLAVLLVLVVLWLTIGTSDTAASYGLSGTAIAGRIGAGAVVVPLALAAALIARRRVGGLVVLVVVAVACATVGGALAVWLIGSEFGGLGAGAWMMALFVVSLAATIVGATALGRNLRVSRALGRIGVRTF